MKRRGIGVFVAVVSLIPTLSAAAERLDERPTAAMVRVFDRTGLSAADLLNAMTETRAILNRAGIEVSWANCSDPRSQPAVCKRPLRANDLLLRVMNAQSGTAGHASAMGYSFVDPMARQALLATVYDDVVRSIALRARVDRRRLLGRVIAHEIGHLLLNTNDHADAGLMRAMWSHVEIRHDNSTDWRIGEDEARIMRASLARER